MQTKYILLAVSLTAIFGSFMLFNFTDQGKDHFVFVQDGFATFLLGIIGHEPSSGVSVTGAYKLVVYDGDGNIKSSVLKKNLVVNEGIQTIADLTFPDINLNGNSTDNKFEYLGIGSSSTAVAAGQTDVQSPIGGCARIQDGTVEGSFSSNTAHIQLDAQFSGANCAATVEEVAVFNSLNGGEMLSRALTGSIVVGSGDTLTVNYNFTIADDGV